MSSPSAPRTRPLRILVADDDADTRSAVCTILSEEGCDVLEACNGAEALALAHLTRPPNLIVLDLMMPVMDGLEFLRRQRVDPQIADTPVVVMTASGDVSPIALGAVAVLPKPVSMDTLLSIVHLARPESAGGR